MRRGKAAGPWTVFGAPLILGVLALIGLVGALLENGLWDGLGAALLAVPAGAVLWARFGRR